MRYALISDIHANEPALRAVLQDIARRAPDASTYHLGDLVGYGASPDLVVGVLQRLSIPGVAGNYDSTVATAYKHCGCRYEDARQEALSHLSYEWTLAHTSSESKRYLRGLPFRIDLRPLGGHQGGPVVTLIHGNQVLNTVYVTEDRSDEFLLKMAVGVGAKPGDALCFGHTHKPWHREVQGIHFVNTGSVGRPKDGDWRAGYVLLTGGAEGIEAEIIRVEYDVEAAARAIIASELPNDFAEQLRNGGLTGPPPSVIPPALP